jgi:hypothetical protein
MAHVRLKQVKTIISMKRSDFSLDLSLVPVDTIRYSVINATIVRLKWPKHSFSVQVRLKNIETNVFESPTESYQTSALFDNLTEASIYQVQFNISKPNFLSINQTTDYIIRTGEYFSISSKNKLFFRIPRFQFLV